jgi:hypothetical protein
VAEHSTVVVWELRGLVEDVHCFFEPRGPSMYQLLVERAGERLLEESHDDFREMMSRARDLRSSLIRVGFEPVSARAAARSPLSSLLRHFVKAGTAPVPMLGPALGQRPS